jgi:Xaa-Pro dipeptidase
MNKYTEHVATLEQRWATALAANSFDAALIDAGARQNYFLDDQAPPFRANPHFSQWLDGAGAEHALLLIRPGLTPRLFLHQPRDYWHQPPTPPDLENAIDVAVFDSPDAVVAAALQALERENRACVDRRDDARSNRIFAGCRGQPTTALESFALRSRVQNAV